MLDTMASISIFCECRAATPTAARLQVLGTPEPETIPTRNPYRGSACRHAGRDVPTRS